MNAIFIKLRLLIFLTFLLLQVVQAQQARFIYIQTENKQPFYVKMDKRILSSSLSGYIIISRLVDSTYNLVIGFPKNEWPEMNVAVNVKENHAGLLLKYYGKGDWGMVNLQSMQLQVMQRSPPPVVEVEVKKSEDEFAIILAAVVNDPSIAEVTILKAQSITNPTTENKTEKLPLATAEIKPDTVLMIEVAELVDKPRITKLMQDSNPEGLSIIYLDKENAGTDTVIIYLPQVKAATIEKNNRIEITDTVKKDAASANKDSRFIDMELQNPNVKADSTIIRKDDFVITEKKAVPNSYPEQQADTSVADTKTGKVMINSDCKKNATENDFLKLRKLMAAQSSEKNMLVAAYKQFIKICFTTEQIKNLGVLFITQEEKYKFFVAAFPFVSDTHNFAKLDEQLTDNYYKTRFKAMLSR